MGKGEGVKRTIKERDSGRGTKKKEDINRIKKDIKYR
jgi:hypothetical protein